ncbi:hypothetical protein KMU_17220 [Proteus vulgaris]|nr:MULTISPECIES: hypothetical protein [Proteus]QKJ49002.1 hypothetical protein G9394_10835 [Proteus vulgaris]GLX63681.1 hypothetical protein KMU_17220 [Proteus vulgaris]
MQNMSLMLMLYDYYRVLGEADKLSDSTCFIDFILKLIAQALKEGIKNS